MPQNSIVSLPKKSACNIGARAQIVMPENYIAMFKAPEREEAESIVRAAEPAIADAIACLKAKKPFPATQATSMTGL